MKLTNSISYSIDRIRPWHILVIGVFVTLGFAVIYRWLSIRDPQNGLILPTEQTSQQNFVSWGDAIYFSIVTEATLGYGDIRPVGFSRLLACLQVLLGLTFAGIVVAKITSSHGKKLRRAAFLAKGYWIEPFAKEGQDAYFTFSHFFFDGDTLHYTGDNYNRNGKFEGSFVGKMISYNADFMVCDYINVDKKHLFEDGICKLKFSKAPGNKHWTSHTAVCHDHGKSERMYYYGIRANKEEISIMLGQDKEKQKILIQNYISDFDKKRNYNN